MAIPKDRRSQPEADATVQEVSTARGAIGSLAWLAKEGRPDLAGAASMLASKLTTLKVKDMICQGEPGLGAEVPSDSTGRPVLGLRD